MGGRVALVISWVLGLPTRRREVKVMRVRWETMTGWRGDVIDEDLEDADERVNNGHILGDVTDNIQNGRQHGAKWEKSLLNLSGN